MKSLKWLLSVTIVCLFVGASGTAMAQVVDTCDEGHIWLTAVDEIVVDGRSCAIVDVLVKGNVTATGGSTISLHGSQVGGDVTVTGAGNVIIVKNQLLSGVLRVDGNQTAIVVANNVNRSRGNFTEPGGSLTPGGSILVNNHQEATVKGNIVGRDLQCEDNVSLQSDGNIVIGNNTCP